jgi:hypothetical protein
MNRSAKSIFTVLGMILLAGPAFAAMPSDKQVIHDKPAFFAHLDVDKVLASTDISGQCGIIPAKLDYLDQQGREHLLNYQVEGSGCTNDH